jgi:putative DNA primase/helicase
MAEADTPILRPSIARPVHATGEVIDSFRAALAARDIIPPVEVIADGRIRRCDAAGKNGKADAAYLLHLDRIPAGGFENWRDGKGWENWRFNIGRALTPVELEALRTKAEIASAQRKEEAARRHAAARALAARIWQGARPAVDEHPYLAGKGVAAHGLRIHKGALVIPIHDAAGELHSLQFIGPDGERRFLAGGHVTGCYYLIGEPQGVLCIAEGYATGASVHEATGYAFAVAFNAGNLLPVARALRLKFPGLRLIVCADDDAVTPGNPGLTKAREAAQGVGGFLAIPDFGINRPEGVTDFNDLHRHAGVAAVRRSIERAKPVESSLDQEAWPEPKPIIAALKPVPAFDADTLLPGVLRAWVMDEAERMPCPPDFIAAAALVALGSIIGARCAIKPKARDSWLIVPNLWGGIVGDPSAKKSPAWGAALKPVDRLIAGALEEHRAALAEYETAKVVFDAQKDAIEGRIKEAAKKPSKGDPVAIARELRTHGEQAPDAPTLRRYKTNDSTVEKLGELLRENPSGLLVLRDELVGLIATWDRDGREGERAFFLEGWNGNQSFDTDRIGRGHISIPNLCVSIFGGIQPDRLTVYLEQAAHALANDGMLQRFQLLVYPDPRRWEWRDRSPNKAAQDAAFAVFATLADFDPVAWGAAPVDDFAKFPWFCFDDDAQAIFIEWSEDLHCGRMPNEDEPIIRQHLAKFDKLFPALALVLYLVESSVDGIRGAVDKEAALRAAAWCEFLEAHARRCYGLLKDDGLRAAQALAAKLERGALEDGFTLRDVRRNQWRNLTADDAIQAALDWLEDEDWLRGESSGGTGPGSGRRTVRYRINPAITGKRNGVGE